MHEGPPGRKARSCSCSVQGGYGYSTGTSDAEWKVHGSREIAGSAHIPDHHSKLEPGDSQVEPWPLASTTSASEG